jgi:hypothetical protein
VHKRDAAARKRSKGKGRTVKNEGGRSSVELETAVSAKLEESNYNGAVRLLCSDDSIAPNSAATLQALRDKNQPAPPDRHAYPESDSACLSLITDETSVRKAIMSFLQDLQVGQMD